MHVEEKTGMANKVKIILNQDVLNLGEEGDIRDVAPGYARNYLFPRKMAVPHTEHQVTILSQKRRKLEKRKEEKKIQAQSLKEQIQKEEIVFTLQAGEHGKLFGSITNGPIAEELQKRGYAIERKKIEVPDHHLKMVGDYTIRIKLYGDEEALVKVSVKALELSPEEKAAKQSKQDRGRSKTRRAAEDEIAEQAAPEAGAESEAAEAAEPAIPEGTDNA
jgi:large subunit ribosomal protein L9